LEEYSFYKTNYRLILKGKSNTPEFDYVPLTPNTSAVNIEFETDVNNDIFTELKEVRKRHPNQSAIHRHVNFCLLSRDGNCQLQTDYL
jgi:uncharacterized protein (DUF927 family)